MGHKFSQQKKDNDEEERKNDSPNIPSQHLIERRGNFPIIYRDEYNISFWHLESLHPFDSKKYGKVYKELVDKQIITKEDNYVPKMITDEMLLKIHPQSYLDSLNSSMTVAQIVEIAPVALLPNFLVHKKLLNPMKYATAGTVLGAELAVFSSSSGCDKKVKRYSLNISGGFHHCSAREGGGFCVYADISLAILNVHKHAPSLTKYMIIDLDSHQGNGHENDKLNGVFKGIDVFIMDMFNKAIYPHDSKAKQAINCMVELDMHTEDETYLGLLQTNLQKSLRQFTPDLIIYNAGTDVLINDPLGCLNISAEGIVKRDEIVFDAAFSRSIPILMLLSGGYQKSNAGVIASSIKNLNNKFGLFKKEQDAST